MTDYELHHGDNVSVLNSIDAEIQCTVTSPPYFGHRDYDGSLTEFDLSAYVDNLVKTFSAVRELTTKTGTLWINLADTYNAYNGNRGKGTSFSSSRHEDRPSLPTGHGLTEKSLPNKALMGSPWRVALAVQDSGWTLRNAIIWRKPRPAPERVTDRLSRCYEHVFMFSRSDRYEFHLDFLRMPGERIPMDYWEFPQAGKSNHPAAFPVELPRRCIGLGSSAGSTVLDPFVGSGTTAVAAVNMGRRFIGIDTSQEYIRMAKERLGHA